jgi:hypothetical protein
MLRGGFARAVECSFKGFRAPVSSNGAQKNGGQNQASNHPTTLTGKAW